VLRRGEVGEVYNIGGGNETTNRELTEKVLDLCGAGEEMIEYVTDRLGHDRRYSIDCTKARALGWAPARTLDEALAATVEWYRANRAWWEPLKG
jgi:dTDP-glucose 4,6-dehydratase